MKKLSSFLLILFICNISFADTYVKRYPNDNAVKVAPLSGSTTSGNCVKFDANGNIVDAGAACGSGGGGTGNVGIGTVNAFAGYVGISTIGPFQTVEVAGNVGIGVTAPSAKLHVLSDTRSTYFPAGSTGIQIGYPVGSAEGLALWENDATGSTYIGSLADTTTQSLNFVTRASSLTNNIVAMSILGSANVGIGSLTPSSKLDVFGSQRILSTGNLSIGTSGSSYKLWVNDSNGASSTGVKVEGNATRAQGGHNFQLFNSDHSTGQAIFTVWGGNNTSIQSFGTADTGNEGDWGLPRAGLVIYGGNGVHAFGSQSGKTFLASSGGVGVTVENGNVGVGTQGPRSKLEVFGTSIFSGGNVGIGTVTAPSQLYVAGTTETQAFKMNASPGAGYVLTSNTVGVGTWMPAASGGSGTINSGVTNYHALYAGATTIDDSAVLMDNGTNVGIGTGVPQSKLDVTGSDAGTTITAASASMGAITNTNTTVNNFGDLAFCTGTSTGAQTCTSKIVGIHVSHTNGAASGALAFVAQNAGTATEKMRIDQIGNVGIGTTTPVGGLTVMSGNVGIGTWVPSAMFQVGSGANKLTVSSTGDLTAAGSIVGSSGIVGYLQGPIAYVSNSQDSYLFNSNLGIGTTATSTSRLTVIGGNVGIGTWKPSVALDVKGALTLTGTLTGAGAAFGSSVSGSSFTSDTFWTTSTADMKFYTTAGFTERMRILTGGNVGIGTTNPQAFLEVKGAGNAQIFRNTSSTGYTGLRMANDTDNSLRTLEIDYSGSAYPSSLLTSGPAGESGSITTTGAYPLVFGTSNTARMTVASGGNIGIGTFKPVYPLDIKVATDQHFVFRDASGTSSLEAINDANNLNTSFTVRGSPLILNDGSTNVGIGSVAPSQKLDVTGSIRTSVVAGQADGTILCVKSGRIGYCSGAIAGISCTCN